MPLMLYPNLVDAVTYATTLCERWEFYNDRSFYDPLYLMDLAKANDQEFILDEDGSYVVSEEGAIGQSDDGEEIQWLVIPVTLQGTLPNTIHEPEVKRFCTHCGAVVLSPGKFCGQCGGALA